MAKTQEERERLLRWLRPMRWLLFFALDALEVAVYVNEAAWHTWIWQSRANQEVWNEVCS